MDFFSRTKLCQAVAILPSSIPERSIALVNDWLVHQKELKLIPTCPTLTKVLPKVARILIYIDGSFSRTKLCQAVVILPSSIFLNVQLH
jgi:hypothetical protein